MHLNGLAVAHTGVTIECSRSCNATPSLRFVSMVACSASKGTQLGPWANLSGSPGLLRPPHHSSIGSAVDARANHTNTHRALAATHALPKATRTNWSTHSTRRSEYGALHKVLSKSIRRCHETSGAQLGAAIRLSVWFGFRLSTWRCHSVSGAQYGPAIRCSAWRCHRCSAPCFACFVLLLLWRAVMSPCATPVALLRVRRLHVLHADGDQGVLASAHVNGLVALPL